MKKAMAMIVVFVLMICSVCIAEATYDATSEAYSIVESSDPDAAAFASDLAQSNATLFEQYGIKTVLYIVDSFDGVEPEQYAEAIVAEREDTSSELIYFVATQDQQYTVWAGENPSTVLTPEVITEIMDSVAAEENETIWAAVAKAYVGIGFRLMTNSIGGQFQ